jgi:hypothetical protein
MCKLILHNLQQRLDLSKNNPFCCNILGEGSETVKDFDVL